MQRVCAACGGSDQRDEALYCARCGADVGVVQAAPLAPPVGFQPVQSAQHLYFHCESALGGPRLIGTEGAKISLFNAGVSMRDATFQVRGHGRDNVVLFDHTYPVESLPRGEQASIDVPSYDIDEPIRILTVRFVQGITDRAN